MPSADAAAVQVEPPAAAAADNETSGNPEKSATSVSDNYMRVETKAEYVRKNPDFRRGYVASVMTLCLGIMGGAVLPVPWAFSVTGAVCGVLLCIIVAWVNVYTADLLIRQCYKTSTRDYEELAYAVGGTPWLIITRISILILMYGSMIAAIQQSAEAAIFALQGVTSDLPYWLTYDEDTGYVLMLLFTFVIAFPLCLVKQLRSLEYAGMVGFVVILVLTGDIVVQSIASGLPALKSGDFPAVGFQSIGSIASSIAILGFAFFIQPLMMPLLNEMPGPPRSQARILSWAMRFVVVVFAGGVYVLIGFFGAAWYGTNTEGNILQNVLLGGGAAQCVLNFLLAIYLALSFPPIEFVTRRIFDNWLPGQPGGTIRQVIITLVTICAVLAVAMFWHSGSATLLVITGASGVLMASYICPIVNHLLLYFGRAKCQRLAKSEFDAHIARLEASHADGHVAMKMMTELGVPLGDALPPMGPLSVDAIGRPGVLTYRKDLSEASVFGKILDVFMEVFLPTVILAFGALCSVAAFIDTFAPQLLSGDSAE